MRQKHFIITLFLLSFTLSSLPFREGLGVGCSTCYAAAQSRTVDKYLPETERMMEMLGYKVHARLIWDKINGPAAAYTVRFSHEYLIWFFKPGQILMPDKDRRGAFPTVMREPSRKHSQKPECAYEMIESMFPDAKKLELFARNERKGWDCWGNEV